MQQINVQGIQFDEYQWARVFAQRLARSANRVVPIMAKDDGLPWFTLENAFPQGYFDRVTSD